MLGSAGSQLSLSRTSAWIQTCVDRDTGVVLGACQFPPVGWCATQRMLAPLSARRTNGTGEAVTRAVLLHRRLEACGVSEQAPLRTWRAAGSMTSSATCSHTPYCLINTLMRGVGSAHSLAPLRALESGNTPPSSTVVWSVTPSTTLPHTHHLPTRYTRLGSTWGCLQAPIAERAPRCRTHTHSGGLRSWSRLPATCSTQRKQGPHWCPGCRSRLGRHFRWVPAAQRGDTTPTIDTLYRS